MIKSAVEWLWDISQVRELMAKDFQYAIEIEKQKMKEMYLKGIENYDPTFKRKCNETLKENHIVDTNKMVEDTYKVWECCGMEECICKGSDATNSEIPKVLEISDEEIENCVGDGMHDFYKGGFIEGAKWYREKLKNK